MIRISLLTVELHEDKIPNLQEAVVLGLQQFDDAVVTLLRILVPVNFGIGSAGAGIGHLPEFVEGPCGPRALD